MKKITLIFILIFLAIIGLSFYYFHYYVNENVENSLVYNNYQKRLSDENINLDEISKKAYDNPRLEKIIGKFGIKETMAALLEQSGGGSTFDCHQQAHQIGRIGYRVEGAKAFGSRDLSCHSGCYHGAMESFLNEKGTVNLTANINAICKTFDTHFSIFECLHGVGHGLLAYTDYDMPEAIQQCKSLETNFDQSSCYGGMFMENILTAQGLGAGNNDHQTSWANKTDPLFPCNKIDQSYDIQYQCYQMQTSWILTLFNADFDRIAKECLKAPTNMIPVCFKSFGRDAAGNSLRNPKIINETCNKAPKEKDYYDQCIVGATNVIIDFWGPGLNGQASDLCKILSEPGKKTCYDTISSRLPGIFNKPEERLVICKTFEPSYQNTCR